ncbi:MAG: hypothetical protein EBZ36_10545 [Acidobacteria bacterium]|nr:hypothetical protein [Acidobacteriota bacterium]
MLSLADGELGAPRVALLSPSTGCAPEFAATVVGQMNCDERPPVPRKVSQTCDSLENARTAEKLKLVEPVGMLWTTW